MKLSQFKYTESPSLFAQEPLKNRDDSRLLVLHKNTGKIEHKSFKDLIKYFKEDDVFVMNNTKVFPAKLYGVKEKTGADIEVFLLRELDISSKLWDVLVDPARKIRIGNKLYFGEDNMLVAEVIDNTTSRGRTLRFLYDGTYEEFKGAIHQLGHIPLPEYIKREDTKKDAERFQTIFAKHEGAVDAPSAGLHFSREMIKKLEIKGINIAELTLHISTGSQKPVEVEDLTKHKMDSEKAVIPEATANMVNNAIKNNKRICAVDTSVVRALETSVTTDGFVKPFAGWTNKFIFPPYEFEIPNALLLNFYRSESVLFMLGAAFCDLDMLKNTYKEAIKEKYRFLAYGDAMLII